MTRQDGTDLLRKPPTGSLPNNPYLTTLQYRRRKARTTLRTRSTVLAGGVWQRTTSATHYLHGSCLH
jgi:hypothetical protein